MKHTYNIAGMTCSGCQAKVHSLLSQVKGVSKVSVDLTKGQADIEMHHHIPTETLQDAFKGYDKYSITEAQHPVLPVLRSHLLCGSL